MMAPHEPLQTSMISLSIANSPNNSIMASHQEEAVDETQTQMDLTQQTLELTQLGEDETSNQILSSQSPFPPLSPQPALPWGRLLPCSISGFHQAFDLFPRPAVDTARATASTTTPQQQELFNIFWLGRSNHCDVTATVANSTKSKKNDAAIQAWAHSMISNKHCRIFCSHNQAGELEVYIEDNSGNGTLINQTTLLRKGEKRLLHSGDEICLVNLQTLRKKIRSNRVLQPLLQQHSFVFVLQQLPTPASTNHKQRKTPCVNPRTMNYVPHQQQQPSGPTSSSSPRPFRRIEEDYEIRDVIGDGTAGQVRRAIHRQTGEARAVKIISLRRNRMQVDSTQMEQEATILRSLDHPYIVKLVDVFVNPGVAIYLVMELVAGGDLFDRIVQQQSYTEVDSRRVMRRLFAAVHYLHEQRNIVHRDLKPENILCVTRDNHIQVKLTDFGLAKIINEDDSLKTFCGTPQYFAPEVLRRRHTVAGRGRYGKPADMWSLGVILYILLSGKPPFNPDDLDDEEDDRSQYDIQFPTDPWSQFHPLAVDLVQKLLREDPKRRLSVSQACTHPWILMEDGDTHIHPLDDPNLTTRKRLFGSPEQQQGEEQEEKSYHMATDEASHSTKDEDCNSILSKESFSAAAQDMSHRRNDSIFDVVVGDAFLQDSHQDAAAETKESSITPMEDDDDDDEKPTEVASSPNEAALMASGTLGESSVTPSEAFDTPRSSPRSPLATMSMNERSNRFREEILVKSNSSNTRSPKNIDGDDNDDPNHSPARDQQGMVRVTPTASNITKRRGSLLEQPFLEGAAEMEEDEICSQFSDQTESLQSFPSSHADSPVAAKQPEAEESSLRKRPRDAAETATAAVPESPKRKQKRQMTLSGWFVKKTTVASTDEKET